MFTPDDVRNAAFSKPTLGKRGYNMHEVDAFLDRIEGTLTGTDDLTAADVRAVVFSKPPIGQRGYNEDEVDNFLDLAEQELGGPPAPAPDRSTPSQGLTADQIRDVSFPQPGFGRRTYDMGQVDAVLARAEATLRGTDNLTAAEVHAIAFTKPPVGKRGYGEDEVDAFLDLVEKELTRRSGAPAQPMPAQQLDAREVAPPRPPAPQRGDWGPQHIPGMVEPKKRWWKR